VLVHNVNNDKKDDDATLQWLKTNEDNLKRQFKDYPNIIDPQSHSLFMLAGARGKLKTMKYLLTLGADLDYIQAKSGDDALSVALYFNEYDVADWLMEDKGMTLDVAEELEENPEREKGVPMEHKAVGRYQNYLKYVRLPRSDPSMDSPLRRSDSDTGHVSASPLRSVSRSDSDSSMGSLRLSFSPFDSPIDETPPLLRATRPDSPINLHMPRNIAMSNVEEFSYTDLPPKPRKSLADVLDRFYKENKI
jgi:hypothetical protein